MSHIEMLLMNEIRKALENLERSGVGYIEYEQTGIFHYKVDGTKIRIVVEKEE